MKAQCSVDDAVRDSEMVGRVIGTQGLSRDDPQSTGLAAARLYWERFDPNARGPRRPSPAATGERHESQAYLVTD